MFAADGRDVWPLKPTYSQTLSLLGHIFVKSLWSGALKLPILARSEHVRSKKSLRFCEKLGVAASVALDLTMSEEVRIVFLVAPNGSERSEKLGSRKHGAEHLSKTCEIFVCA